MKITLLGYELTLKKKKKYKFLMKIPNENYKSWLPNYQNNRPYKYLRTKASVKKYISKGGIEYGKKKTT